MIDLHNHLLPGLDDGAPDLKETLKMARRGWADGIRTFAVTPHLFWDHRENRFETVKKLSAEVEQFLKEQGVPLRILAGTEVPSREASLTLLKEERMPTLGGSRCVLLEPPFAGIEPNMDRFVAAFLDQGFRILLAHPERCRSLQENPDLVDTFLPPEMPLQLTSHSILGEFGPRPQETAMAYLSSGRPLVISTDSHSSHYRVPELSHAMKVAAGVVGWKAARRMVEDNPLALLEDRPIPLR